MAFITRKKLTHTFNDSKLSLLFPFQRAKKPDWAPTDRCMYGLLDTIAVAPLGYASYLVYKYGGKGEFGDPIAFPIGTEDTTSRIALGLYGFNVLMMITNMPLLKQRDHGAVSIFV